MKFKPIFLYIHSTLLLLFIFTSFSLAPSVKASTVCTLDFQELNFCGDIQFLKTPSPRYSSDFNLRFWDKDTLSFGIPSQSLHVYLWMKMPNGHSHGSAPVKIGLLDDKESFNISNVWFIMNGKWQIHVELKEGNHVLSKAIKEICIGPEGQCH